MNRSIGFARSQEEFLWSRECPSPYVFNKPNRLGSYLDSFDCVVDGKTCSYFLYDREIFSTVGRKIIFDSKGACRVFYSIFNSLFPRLCSEIKLYFNPYIYT